MEPEVSLPQALTIAGFDPFSFAGFSADLRTFSLLGVAGMAASTALTVQSPNSFSYSEPVEGRVLRDQVQSILNNVGPVPLKIGLVPSWDLLVVISDLIDIFAAQTVVLDPVVSATAGSGLSVLDVSTLADGLFSRCSLVTPNCLEANALCHRSIQNQSEQTDAAKHIFDRFGCWVLLKGGHLSASSFTTDILYTGSEVINFSRLTESVGSVHGSGCFLSSAIVGFAARGFDLLDAVHRAEEFTTEAFMNPRFASGHPLLWPVV